MTRIGTFIYANDFMYLRCKLRDIVREIRHFTSGLGFIVNDHSIQVLEYLITFTVVILDSKCILSWYIFRQGRALETIKYVVRQASGIITITFEYG